MAAKKKKGSRRRGPEPRSRGLEPAAMHGDPPPEVTALAAAVARDGGAPLGTFRDPLGGHWLVLAALPIECVAPTPFQRDLSAAHLKRLTRVIEDVGRFLDPILVTREGEGSYWTPNGNHRLAAMRELGARAISALVVPDRKVAFQILALNTEKAHNLKEKSLEVIRMARALAVDAEGGEREFALEFEEPVFLTLGPCYEHDGRFAGGAYRPALARVESFLDTPLEAALEVREERARELLRLDAVVTAIIGALKERGIESPYLRSWVTARINPVRFRRDAGMTPEQLVLRMRQAAERFDVAKVRPEQIQGGAAPPPEEED